MFVPRYIVHFCKVQWAKKGKNTDMAQGIIACYFSNIDLTLEVN